MLISKFKPLKFLSLGLNASPPLGARRVFAAARCSVESFPAAATFGGLWPRARPVAGLAAGNLRRISSDVRFIAVREFIIPFLEK